jgi:hypothetical protein
LSDDVDEFSDTVLLTDEESRQLQETMEDFTPQESFEPFAGAGG